MMLAKLLELYDITFSPHILHRILNEYTEEEIVKTTDCVGIVYYLFKENPRILAYLDRERSIEILDLLNDELLANPLVLDKCKMFAEAFDLIKNPWLIEYVKKIADSAVSIHKRQGFEITSETITETDVRELIASLMKPLESLSIESALDYIDAIISPYNCEYLISELSTISERDSNLYYSDLLLMIERIIYDTSNLEVEEPDYDAEDYNPLEDYIPNLEEIIEEQYNSEIPIILEDMDKVDTMSAIKSIRIELSNKNVSNIMKDICNAVITPYIDSILKEYNNLKEQNYSPYTILNDIIEIPSLIYRLPRILYLCDGSFGIESALINPSLHIERKVLKDLELIEHMCRQEDERVIKVDFELLDKLIPIEVDDTSFNDDYIYSSF